MDVKLALKLWGLDGGFGLGPLTWTLNTGDHTEERAAFVNISSISGNVRGTGKVQPKEWKNSISKESESRGQVFPQERLGPMDEN